jgi:hypothetical protein
VFWRARHIAREWADTHVERPVARALVVGSALRRERPDVLYFGDSSLIHVSPDDTDKRRLGEMFAEESGRKTAQYYGPAYSAELWGEFARLITDLPRPRCVVVSLCIRPATHRHVYEHPIFGYRSAAQALRSARRAGPALARRLYKTPPGPADYARFEAIEHESVWNLAGTMGEYRRKLKGYDPASADEQSQRVIYDYFHGEYSAGRPGLQHWRRFGERLRTLGVPVVAYRTYMPLDAGTRLLGEQFVPHVEENFRLLEEAFFGGLGGGAPVAVDPPSDAEFINHRDATEHLNEHGRQRLVKHLIAAVNERLG